MDSIGAAHRECFRAGAIGRKTDSTRDLTSGDMLGRLAEAAKRNLVNTYVWTAAGGQFAEEMQSLDSRSEATGGAYAFSGAAGLRTEFSS